jgi:WS/DGAT/MGAT family acyltransferase
MSRGGDLSQCSMPASRWPDTLGHRTVGPEVAVAGKVLTGLDALFLYLESAGTPMHVASLMRLVPARPDPGFPAALRKHLCARLAALPMLRWVLEQAPLALDHPRWRDGGAPDWETHIRVQALGRGHPERALSRTLAELHAEPLPRDRPLWQIVILSGLPKGELGLYLKSHHALVDGQAGVALTAALLDRPDAASGGAPPASKATSAGGDARRLASLPLGRMLRGVPASVQQLRELLADGSLAGRLRDSVWWAPRTPFNRTITGARRLALVSLPLADLKRCARGYAVSLNDVLMCLVADALRADLLRRGKLPEQPLVAAMPVSLRGAGRDAGNEVSMVQCPLPTQERNPVRRLAAIAEATRAIKGRVQAFRGMIPTDFPGLGAPLWASGLSRIWKRGRLSERLPALANLVVSNVPGPPLPQRMAGAAIGHWYPISIVTHGLGLNVTMLSYADSMEVGVVSAPECLARPDTFARALQRGLQRLQARLPA